MSTATRRTKYVLVVDLNMDLMTTPKVTPLNPIAKIGLKKVARLAGKAANQKIGILIRQKRNF